MESINIFKGYGKVVNPKNDDHHHQQIPNPNPRTRRLFAISALLLLTLLIGLLIGALIHESTTEPPESPSLDSNSAESVVRAACNVTRYPDSCFASIITAAGLNGSSDPGSVLKVSVEVSVAELSKLTTQLKAMNSGEAALRDCRELVEEALSRLGESERAVADATEAKMKDAQTWIGAAVTDLGTCLEGLEEVGSTALLDEVKVKMNKSKEYTSNALAIVANFHAILDKLHMVPH
ncbi:Pectinesterase inhibitor domain containing protein [Trema orientale]|uniref:pectinesterase n=1 Tax=Trema orientale TaxID=63057 RepID=A0A2P5F759_TREOI|nr:Pectinesterase inhibitor domain containing protein [Trema orientale]